MSSEQQVEVLIGKKPPVNYVLAIMEALMNRPGSAVVVKARGRAICKAVDVINMVKSRYFKDLYVKSFNATYEEVQEEKGKVRLPSVEIVVARAQAQP